VPPITPAAARAEIAGASTRPLYVLLGDDAVERDAMAAEFLEVVDEGLRPFNVDRLRGGEMTVADLSQAAATFPMMAPRRLVIVAQAERLFEPRREGKAADEEQARLEAFLNAPPAHATIVFVTGSVDRRRRVVKVLLEQAAVVDCGVLNTPEDAERWVKVRAARDMVPLDPGAVRAVVQRAGTDLPALRAAIERVALYTLGQPAITASDVRAAVLQGPEEQQDFGVAKAIWRGDAAAALRELALALEAGAPPVLMMGQLRAAAEKLTGPRLTDAIEAVMRTDLALKSSGGDQRVLLERLAVELCGPAAPARIRRPLS
jgi:DNA polymerase-3 subunit delta